MKRILLLALIALSIVAFFAFDLQQLLTLEGLRASLAGFEAERTAHPLGLAALYFALYVLVTALSIPGATILTLASGALYGLLWGTVIVSFASTVGATLAFLASRYLFRDWVQRRFADRLAAVNEGVRKEGAFYLFALRLVPLVPFFLINLLMGLTPLRAATFYWVSQIGMLAGTLVYVNAGTQLAALDSPSGILSPTLLISFTLLGIFPLIARKTLDAIRARRIYARFDRPARFDRNLVVIGAGAAGLVSALIGATVKAKVTLIEARKMGGDCLNHGCVPSKTLIRAAALAHEMRHAERYGLTPARPVISIRQVMERVQESIRTIEPHDSVERYTDLGVDVLSGHARILDPWTVEVMQNDGGTRTLTTRSIVIAAGARPLVPPLPGIDDVGYLTSDTLWDALSNREQVPDRLAILGGGPIGCELSQSFARLGSRVTQVEMAPRLLLREDVEVSAAARTSIERDGVTVLTEHRALRFERQGDGKFLVAEHAGHEVRIPFDDLICAVGRTPRLTGYGLEDLGVVTDSGLATDEYLATIYPNIYAAGDVAGAYQFTHVASHEAWYAAVNALFGQFWRFRADYRVIPRTTFIDPEIARVGLNEQQAREEGTPVEVTRYDLAGLDRAVTDGATTGFIKVLTVPGSDRILGATIVGRHGSDLLAEFVLAMKQGIGLNRILGTIHTYPTWSEGARYVASEWRKAHAPQKLLEWVEKYHGWRRR